MLRVQQNEKMPVDDLIAFLNAQIDEDEDEARDRHEGHCATAGPIFFPCDCRYPARALREVESLRAIVADHRTEVTKRDVYPFSPYTGEPNLDEHDGDCAICGWFDPKQGGCRTLRLLAAIWSDHPDYRPEWKPS